MFSTIYFTQLYYLNNFGFQLQDQDQDQYYCFQNYFVSFFHILSVLQLFTEVKINFIFYFQLEIVFKFKLVFNLNCFHLLVGVLGMKIVVCFKKLKEVVRNFGALESHVVKFDPLQFVVVVFVEGFVGVGCLVRRLGLLFSQGCVGLISTFFYFSIVGLFIANWATIYYSKTTVDDLLMVTNCHSTSFLCSLYGFLNQTI